MVFRRACATEQIVMFIAKISYRGQSTVSKGESSLLVDSHETWFSNFEYDNMGQVLSTRAVITDLVSLVLLGAAYLGALYLAHIRIQTQKESSVYDKPYCLFTKH